MFYAEKTLTGWIYRQQPTPPQGEHIVLTLEEFDALCDERSEILFGKVVYRA